jgi:membrane dipeptidase
MARHLVWDNHGCMPVARPHDTSFLPQLQRYREAGVNAVTLNIGFGDQGVEDHLRTIASFRRWLLDRPDQYLLLSKPEDLTIARATGRLAVGFDIEGSNPITLAIVLVVDVNRRTPGLPALAATWFGRWSVWGFGFA